MNEDFIPFELADKLKEKGFPLKYKLETKSWSAEYKRVVVLPNIYEVLKWFRKEHHLHFEVVGAAYGYNLIISDTPDKGGTDRYHSHANYDGHNDGGAWDKYEDCINYGIKYVLNNLI